MSTNIYCQDSTLSQHHRLIRGSPASMWPSSDRSYLIRQRWDAIHSLTIVSPEREPQKGGEEEPPTEEMETTA